MSPLCLVNIAMMRSTRLLKHQTNQHKNEYLCLDEIKNAAAMPNVEPIHSAFFTEGDVKNDAT